jgi:hypothetical protein
LPVDSDPLSDAVSRGEKREERKRGGDGELHIDDR